MRANVSADIRSIFNSPDLLAANARLKELVASYFKSAPKLASWMEENLPQGFAVFALFAASRAGWCLCQLLLAVARRWPACSLGTVPPLPAFVMRLLQGDPCG